MRRLSSPSIVVGVVGLLQSACSHTTSHSLESPAGWSGSARPGQGSCSVGIARLVDQQGVDYALDFRDFLREKGPCRTVRVVSDPVSDQVDYVVSGRLRGQYLPQTTSEAAAVQPLAAVGAAFAGGGLPLFLVGVLAKPTAPNRLTGSPGTSQSELDALEAVGGVMLAVGAVALVGGLGAHLDNGGARQLSVEPLDADIEITHGGDTAARLSLHDSVQVRARPLQRTEPKSGADDFAPLQRDVVERVFEHVAAKLGELAAHP